LGSKGFGVRARFGVRVKPVAPISISTESSYLLVFNDNFGNDVDFGGRPI